MNEFEAIVTVLDNYGWITFKYEYEDESYFIQVPKTKKNEFLKSGDKITVLLAILPEEITDERLL